MIISFKTDVAFHFMSGKLEVLLRFYDLEQFVGFPLQTFVRGILLWILCFNNFIHFLKSMIIVYVYDTCVQGGGHFQPQESYFETEAC